MAKVKTEFFERVMRENIVDTNKYRYTVKRIPGMAIIRRIPIQYLDTTLALTEWESIAATKDGKKWARL